MAEEYPMQPVEFDRRIDEMSEAEFATFEAAYRDSRVPADAARPQTICRTCTLEMLRQEMLELLRAYPPGPCPQAQPPDGAARVLDPASPSREFPSDWEILCGMLEEWAGYATATLVQSRAAEAQGGVLICDLCRKPDGLPSWQPPDRPDLVER